MIPQLLRCGRCTKWLPYVRGLGLVRNFYEHVLPEGDLRLRVDDFDDDLKMDVDVRDTIGINVWHRPRLFEGQERKLFCSAVTPGCVVLDIGANVGIYTLLAAKRGAKVVAVEADPRNIEILRHHISLNGFSDRVTVFQIAASNKEGPVSLFRDRGNSGHSNVFCGTDPVVVPGKTIDSLGLPPIDVCKMDVEGAEMMALAGMEKSISRSSRMKLLIEYNPGLGQTDGMIEFVCERFASVWAIRRPPLRPEGPLASSQRPRAFCNLWASKVVAEASGV